MPSELVVNLAIAVISILLIGFAMVLYFSETHTNIATSAPGYISGVVPGLVFFREKMSRKKGLGMVMKLLAAVLMLVIVGAVFLLLFSGIASDAPSSSNNFAYNIYDALIRNILMVSG